MSTYVEKEGQILPYKCIYKNNKNTYYRVKLGYIEVNLNKRYPILEVQAFLLHHFDRFYDALSNQKIERDDQLILWGNTYELRSMMGNFKYEIKDNTIYLHTRHDLHLAKKRIYLQEMIKMCQVLKQDIEPVLKQEGIALVPLKYKYLKSKFGSYHRRHHEITLNTVLAKLDPIYLKYVLYHEYAHIKEFNHSIRFYNVLDRLMPGHRTIQKKLKDVVII